MTLPCLLDSDGRYYASYPIELEDDYAPYPVDVVIDREGVIRYVTNTYDAEALKEIIRQALDEPFSGEP